MEDLFCKEQYYHFFKTFISLASKQIDNSNKYMREDIQLIMEDLSHDCHGEIFPLKVQKIKKNELDLFIGSLIYQFSGGKLEIKDGFVIALEKEKKLLGDLCQQESFTLNQLQNMLNGFLGTRGNIKFSQKLINKKFNDVLRKSPIDVTGKNCDNKELMLDIVNNIAIYPISFAIVGNDCVSNNNRGLWVLKSNQVDPIRLIPAIDRGNIGQEFYTNLPEFDKNL